MRPNVRPGLVEAVVDVRAQRVQRDATLAVELRAAHLRAAEAAGALHRMPLAPARSEDCMPLRMARGTRRGWQLLGDALRDELGVDLGVLHLEDVELHLLAGELLELAADAVGLGAAAADDDAGRAVWMSTRTRSRVRSISTRLMPARSMPLDMSLRIATSSFT
jgi:hypothetical protein